jgi:hypothetical protein
MVVCHRCGKTFKSQQGLSGHQRFKHAGGTALPNVPAYVPGLMLAKQEAAKLREQLVSTQMKLTQLEAVHKKILEAYVWEISELQRKIVISKLGADSQSEIHKIEIKNMIDERDLLQAKIKEVQKLVSALENERVQLKNQVSALEAEKSHLKYVIVSKDEIIQQKDKSIELWKKRTDEERATKDAEKAPDEIAQPSTTQSHLSHLIPPRPSPNPVKSLHNLAVWMNNLQQPKI